MDGAPGHVTASVREKDRVGQSLCCCFYHQPSEPTLACFVVGFYSFTIVHCARRTETGVEKKKAVGMGVGGGDLTKRVGGITKSSSAETRASNPH